MDISADPSPRVIDPSANLANGTGSLKPDHEEFNPDKVVFDHVNEYEATLSEYSGAMKTEIWLGGVEAQLQAGHHARMCARGLPDSDPSPGSDSDDIENLQRSPEAEPEDFDEVRRLGSGGNGNCWLLKRRTDNALRVCKVSKWRPEYNDRKPSEARIFLDFVPQHDRIVQMHYLMVHPWKTQIYFDYYDGGDLHDFMVRHSAQGFKFEEAFIWHCYQQLAEALAYIHTGYDAISSSYQAPLGGVQWTPIIHADIKPMNIFMKLHTDGRFPSLVLGDFGNSKTRPGREYIGTPAWMPPESPRYSVDGDVWGIGAIIQAMCHKGQPPVRSMPANWPKIQASVDLWVRHPAARQRMPLGPDYSVGLDQCIEIAMKENQYMRPSSCDLLDWINQDIHKFFKKYDSLIDWTVIARKRPKHQASRHHAPRHAGRLVPEDEEVTFQNEAGISLKDWLLPPGHHQHQLPRDEILPIERVIRADPDWFEDSKGAWHFRPGQDHKPRDHDDPQDPENWCQDTYGNWLMHSTLISQDPYSEDQALPPGTDPPLSGHWYAPREILNRDMPRDLPPPTKKVKTSHQHIPGPWYEDTMDIRQDTYQVDELMQVAVSILSYTFLPRMGETLWRGVEDTLYLFQ